MRTLYYKLSGYSKSIVHNKRAAARDAGADFSITQREIHERKKPARTPKLISAVRTRFTNDPSVSIRPFVKRSNVTKRTMPRVVYENLKYTTCVRKIRQVLSEDNNTKEF